MKNFKFIDDHTGEEANHKVIGVWRNQSNGKMALAINASVYSLNGLYIDEDGNLHLSRMSIGPVAHTQDIEKEKIEDGKNTWELVRLPLNSIYRRVKRAKTLAL